MKLYFYSLIGFEMTLQILLILWYNEKEYNNNEIDYKEESGSFPLKIENICNL